MACDINNNQAFDIGEAIPLISYGCISYLMDNNELIWKLLKDKTADSYLISNLTRAEKAELIFKGNGDMNDFRVFMDDFQDDAINSEMSFLRIFPIQDQPTNRLINSVDICMQFFTHFRLNHLSNYETRVERVIQQLKETFNGADIPKVGQLVYDQTRSRSCRSVSIGKIPYQGKVIVFNAYTASVQ